jgi:hypothetical protein
MCALAMGSIALGLWPQCAATARAMSTRDRRSGPPKLYVWCGGASGIILISADTQRQMSITYTAELF